MSGAPQGSFNFHIGLDGTVQVAKTLRSLKADVAGLGQAWKAQEINLKSAGQSTQAAEAKYKGLSEQVKSQKMVIAQLREEQSKLDLTNTEGSEAYAKMGKQITAAENKLASMTSQQKRAKDSMQFYKSGLADAEKELKRLTDGSKAYVSRLEAEGKSNQANLAKLHSLRAEYAQMTTVYSKQVSELNKIEKESGQASEAYSKQSIRVNELGSKLASSRSEMAKLSLQNGVMTNSMAKVKDATSKAGGALKSAFSGAKALLTGASVAAAGVGATLVSGARQASALQAKYTETTNLMINGGEKASEVTRNVAKMQADGAKYSMQYGKSQKSIADAYQDLVKRGYSSSQALGAMKSELQGSVASGDDFSDVVKVASTTLESFGMKAKTTEGMTKNTSKAVNMLAYSADMTSTGFSDLGVGMAYVGSVAHQSKVSLAATASAMGILSNNGLEADKAGTGLRKVLLSLADPSAKIMKSIGLTSKSFKDANGNLLPLSESMKILNEHTKNLATGDKATVFKALFGTTGMNAAEILASQNGELAKLTKNTQEAGDKGTYVANLAKKNNTSAQQAIARFKMSADNLKIMMSAQLLPLLSDTADGMTKALGRKDIQKDVKELGKTIASMGQALVKMVGYMIEHQGQVKAVAVSVGSLWAVGKAMKMVSAVKTLYSWLKQVSAIKSIDIGSKLGGTPSVPSTGTAPVSSVGTKTAVSGLMGTVGKVAGAGAAIDVGGSIVTALTSNKTTARVKAASKSTGAAIGGGIGAALGSVIPGAGTLAGAGVGAAIGDALGSTKTAQKWAKSIGKSIKKATAGISVKAPKIDMDDNKLGSSFAKYTKSLSKKLVVSMSTDSKSLRTAQKSVNDTYSKMSKSVDSYYKRKEATAASDLKKLVKNGTMTQKQADAQLAKLKKDDAAEAKSKKASYSAMQKSASSYYSSAIKIATGNTAKLQSIAKKYGKNSTQYEKEKNKELLAAYKSYANTYAKQALGNNSKITSTVKKGAANELKLLKKLTKDKGKLSIAQLNNTAKNAKKEYDAAVKPAKKARDEIIKAANSKYKSDKKIADREYKQLHSINKKQYDSAVASAKKQRDDVTDAAKDQYKKVTGHAGKQYKSVKAAIQKQKDETVTISKAEMVDTTGYASSQSKSVVGHATKQANSSMSAAHSQAKGTHNVFTGLAKWWNKIIKALGGHSHKHWRCRL